MGFSNASAVKPVLTEEDLVSDVVTDIVSAVTTQNQDDAKLTVPYRNMCLHVELIKPAPKKEVDVR